MRAVSDCQTIASTWGESVAVPGGSGVPVHYAQLGIILVSGPHQAAQGEVQMADRALVLGGGGHTAAAWELGLLAGLRLGAWTWLVPT
jgi:hypothetical protein